MLNDRKCCYMKFTDVERWINWCNSMVIPAIFHFLSQRHWPAKLQPLIPSRSWRCNPAPPTPSSGKKGPDFPWIQSRSSRSQSRSSRSLASLHHNHPMWIWSDAKRYKKICDMDIYGRYGWIFFCRGSRIEANIDTLNFHQTGESPVPWLIPQHNESKLQ